MASNVVPVFSQQCGFCGESLQQQRGYGLKRCARFQTDARLTHWFFAVAKRDGNSYVSAFRSNAWHPSNALAAERLRLEVACPYLTAGNKVQEQAGAALGAGISQR
ncbi:hypothetical protein IAE30_14665 [Pantoea sp. S61]|nr:hypothetical protein [Pantoea sp. S61]